MQPELKPAEERHLENVMHNITGAYLDGMNAGLALRKLDIDAVLAAYERAMQDDRVILPSYLHAAIESLRS